MQYEYSGYLRSLLNAPDPEETAGLEFVEFTADDLEAWSLLDDDADPEWQRIPAVVERTEEGVLLRGHFEEVRQIENIDHDDPSFWVALSSRRWEDDRFPIDVSAYPIAEVTYRCTTPWARPAWVWGYPGGQHFDGLQPTREWRRIARRVQHHGFPEKIDRLTLRVYSTSRSTESVEFQSVRFRKETPGEIEAREKHLATLEKTAQLPHYDLLDTFLPIGVCMSAATAKRMAEVMDIGFEDYWRLALEDVARHHHNCISLEKVDVLSDKEWNDLLRMAWEYDIRFVARYDWPMDDIEASLEELVDRRIRPHKDSDSILAWIIEDEPPERTFKAHVAARRAIEAVDKIHPLAVIMRDPNSLPLIAPHFAVTGVSHFQTHVPWDVSEIVRTHLPLSRGQQMWMVAPGFVFATDTPAWSTCPEMRLMVNSAFANGARGWFSFTYHSDPLWTDGHCQRSLTGPFLTFSDLWSELGHRMERFHGMAPLFLNAVPEDADDAPVEVTWREHPRAKRAEGVAPIQQNWLQGPDYQVLHVVSNDIGEVTPVYLRILKDKGRGLGVYDVTEFVRSRIWQPMEEQRHLEMFPGQGQLLLIGEPKTCDKLRQAISDRLLRNDRRQIDVELRFARKYNLDTSEVDELVAKAKSAPREEGLQHMVHARDALTNAIYGAPALADPRSKLIQASAAICGCDGALCRLLGKGKGDQAHEMGVHVMPLTREMANLRLRLRAGEGQQIERECASLVQRILKLLAEIRAVT